MFYDQANITCKAGKGGDGVVHFRREAMVPRGGPDGGNGGRGGDVILRVSRHLNTLQHFQNQNTFEARNGKNGGSQDMTGRSADPMMIEVPPGTVVRDIKTGNVIGDLKHEGQELIVAKGGRGGRGNATFKSATHQAPEIATLGTPGEENLISLELKLIADIGIVGLPNAGKSTLISVITDAKPKIANYPFTTLVPNLGVARIDLTRSVVIADIPGLIEGASAGKGLGHEFLRHIERTRVLIHIVDGLSENPIEDYRTIRAELTAFGHGLDQKPEVIGVSKMDLPDAQAAFELFISGNTDADSPLRGALAFSSATNKNTRQLLQRALDVLDSLPPVEEEKYLPVIEMDEGEDRRFTIEREGGGWRVHSTYLEKKAMITRWELEEATTRFQIALDRSGVSDALIKRGVNVGDIVYVGSFELEWQDETQQDYTRRKK